MHCNWQSAFGNRQSAVGYWQLVCKFLLTGSITTTVSNQKYRSDDAGL
jgi:hypothetical protein